MDALARKRLHIAQRESSRATLARIECLPTPTDGNESQAVVFQYPFDHPFNYGEACLNVNLQSDISERYLALLTSFKGL